jgi:hypothetical protein
METQYRAESAVLQATEEQVPAEVVVDREFQSVLQVQVEVDLLPLVMLYQPQLAN